ncbi:MAG TPA: glycoside hydrolase [Bacillota bacterium]|nr:glycoside hydrolase [Bacillota bacterium]HOL10970.1 glycoside hydrolase [Bacillota bacterium]HPO97381.1 glycoside hydrolase [Bacillota bacterium]
MKRFKSNGCFLLVLLLSVIVYIPIASTEASTTCNLNWDVEKQVIEGFGGSGAFRQAKNLLEYPEKDRNLILDLLFSQEKGIGLSIVRNIIGDGGDWGKPIDGPSPSIQPQDGVWNWKGDEDQIWLMNEARKRGCTRFVSTAWSPPAWMKTNNSVIKGGELRPDKYQAFAEYLAKYVQGYKEHHNIDIYAISPTNEPDLSTDYSSCLWTGSQLKEFIKDHLTPTLKRENLGVKVILPETMNFGEDYALETLNDPEASQGVDIIASHAYDFKAKPFPVAKSHNKSIWQTEVSNIGFNDGSIDDGLKYAKLLHDHMTVTEVNAWFYWWLFSYKDGEALIHLDTDYKIYRTFKRLYTIGNYSRFVRPGYVRIDAEQNPVDNVFVTAYKDKTTGKFAIVVINNGNEERQIDFKLNQFPKLNMLVPYRTSANEDLAKLGKLKVKNGVFNTSLKPKSVTTFVPVNGELPEQLSFRESLSPIEAEDFDSQSGVKIEPTIDGGSAVVFTKKGAYTVYRNLNFNNGTEACELRLALSGPGKLELFLYSPIGTLIGKYSLAENDKKSAAWKKTVYETVSIPTEKVRGVNDLCLVFTPWDQGATVKVDSFLFKGVVKPPAGKIKLQMETATSQNETNTIAPRFKIINSGTVPVNLETVKIRYFYTLDTEAPQQFEYRGGTLPATAVIGTVNKLNVLVPQANYYLEVGFNNTAGTLEPGNEVEVRVAFSIQGGIYRQDNDFSFNPDQGGMVAWNQIAGYINDGLCWGSEPSLLTNSGFETGTTDGWFNFGEIKLRITDETSHTGTYAVLVSGRNESWQGIAQDISKIMKPGKKYEVSAWIKLKDKAYSVGRLSVKRTDDRGDNYSWIDSKPVNDEEWTCISGIYELNVTGTLKELVLYSEGPEPGVEYYVDNVIVKELID